MKDEIDKEHLLNALEHSSEHLHEQIDVIINDLKEQVIRIVK